MWNIFAMWKSAEVLFSYPECFIGKSIYDWVCKAVAHG